MGCLEHSPLPWVSAQSWLGPCPCEHGYHSFHTGRLCNTEARRTLAPTSTELFLLLPCLLIHWFCVDNFHHTAEPMESVARCISQASISTMSSYCILSWVSHALSRFVFSSSLAFFLCLAHLFSIMSVSGPTLVRGTVYTPSACPGPQFWLCIMLCAFGSLNALLVQKRAGLGQSLGFQAVEGNQINVQVLLWESSWEWAGLGMQIFICSNLKRKRIKHKIHLNIQSFRCWGISWRKISIQGELG